MFEFTQRNFAIAGIVPNLAAKPYSLNGKVKLGFLTLGLAIICNFTYTFCEANTFIEYTQSIFMSTLTVIVDFALFTLVVNVKKLFKFIDDSEKAGDLCE